MASLNEGLRRSLERQVIRARGLAEEGAEAALARLAVAAKEPHGHLSADERLLRNRLRERARALGDQRRPNATQEIERLLEEVAYEAWHRMLFARFLAENNLLVHPEHGVLVSLAECGELAPDEGVEDKWVLAARYASRMLPQIFRPNDPSLQVSFAPEHRIGLEQLLEQLPSELFRADDSLGWVYQFWQSERKDEVNAAGEPITGETLPAVTQLFTEPYMVSFLLENTIGAWWTARHPAAAQPVEMRYLRRLEDGRPAAGAFEGWPTSWKDFSILDPSCGSGHFLVAALRLIVPLRMRDEGLSASEAVNAVIRENLYGLELDARCTQIAAFAIALAAWTTPGAHGYRPLPALQIACSGLSVGAKREDWLELADGDQRLEGSLSRLHDLFKLAPELGSLIDPAQGGEDLLTAGFVEVKPLLERALLSERARKNQGLEAMTVVAQGLTKAAELLARKYTLVATNVPYLARGKQGKILREFGDHHYRLGSQDLATAFLLRAINFLAKAGAAALVTPQNWLFLKGYTALRQHLLTNESVRLVARLGPAAFQGMNWWAATTQLSVVTHEVSSRDATVSFLDLGDTRDPLLKGDLLRRAPVAVSTVESQLANPDARIVAASQPGVALLQSIAQSLAGIQSGDSARFGRCFWEVARVGPRWARQQSTVTETVDYGGREHVLLWEDGGGSLAHSPGAYVRGLSALGKRGVVISQMGSLPVTLYSGELFDNNVAVLIPNDETHLSAIWSFCCSDRFRSLVRELDQKTNVTNATFGKIPFDLERWTREAAQRYPSGLPVAYSDDPTQWHFRGDIAKSTAPLQVAVARLVGYRWPDQVVDEPVDALSDSDGLVCLPPVRGETSAADRLNRLLAIAYGNAWSPDTRDGLLASVGFAGKSLDDWLRDGFFEQHAKLFHHRPFVWHITDKAKGGFSALVNYHKLDRRTLEALTYTYLGDWIGRQEQARNNVEERGAEARLGAAKDLQDKLRLILDGEPPYDVFVRWKPLREQPIRWEPDMDDGVRTNIWPFVKAAVLRSKLSVSWNKDRGKNASGAYWGDDRYNRYEDIPREQRPTELRNFEHLTSELKRRARSDHGEKAEAIGAQKPPASSR